MPALKGVVLRLRALLWRSAAERDLDDEIRLHIELETAKNLKAGMSAAEARREAMRVFGGVEVTKEAHRDGRGTRWIEDFVADARVARRMLMRNPAVAIAAIVTLALGIGANTAIFSAVDAVILRPLPFAAPNRLVALWEENPDRGWVKAQVAPSNFLDWNDQVHAFDGTAAYEDFSGSNVLTGAGEPKLVGAALVTGGFFSVLGVTPEVGRSFREDETWSNGTNVVILSHRLWAAEFGSRRDIVGTTIELNSRRAEVVGVLPARFAFPGLDADIWRPIAFTKEDRGKDWFRRAHFIRGFARLRDGATAEQANAELQTVVRRLQGEYPATNTHMGAGITPLHEFLIGDTRRPLMILLAAVSLLLLIACANVGNLLLVQAAGREREMALRLALGARRMRLVRQALTESLLLSGVGGAAGLALGWWGTQALAALQPAQLLKVHDVHVSWGVVGYIAGIATLSGHLFGIAPALWNGARAPSDALKEGGRGDLGGTRMRRWGNALVVTEVALALVLTLGAGLLVRSFIKLQSVNPGFDAKGVLTVAVPLPAIRYDTFPKAVAFYDELTRRARALEGVESAGLVSELPATGYSWSSDFSVAGRPGPSPISQVVHRAIDPGYTAVMRVPLLKGRMFTAADRDGAPLVVLINEALAQKYFPGEDPVGQRVTFDRVPVATSVWRTIVGVVGNERQGTVAEESHPEFLAPYTQDKDGGVGLVIRTRGDPRAIMQPVRAIVAALDPKLAIAHLRTMEEVRTASIARERFLTTLLLVFGVVGLVLAVVGVYGVMAQLVRARTREMGIRAALGAPARSVQWIVVRHGIALACVGIAVGLAVALASTRALLALLYQVDPIDPLTFAATPALLVAAAIAAAWIPAWRASRVDPMETLRSE
jgi:putative ABC transport system permease protein